MATNEPRVYTLWGKRMPQRIEAPFDSYDYPKAVLESDDEEDTVCGHCGRKVEDWPQGDAPGYAPAALYQADLYCPDCIPYSYDETTGELVSTETGEPFTL